MAATYEPIASTTLGSAASSITFSSIPADYTDLVIVVTGANSEGSELGIQLNGDSSTNYSWTWIQGTGSAANSGRASNAPRARIGSFTTGGPHYAHATVMSYANANVYKTVLSSMDRVGNSVARIVGLWRNTSAVNEVKVIVEYGSLQTGTTASLYGIKAA